MPQQINVRYRNLVDFSIIEKQGCEVYFVFGVRKSGSSILNSIVNALAETNGIHYVDVAGALFQKGLRVSDWQNDTGLCDLLRPGNLYGGFRNFPSGLYGSELFRPARKILMVRDPRDALVSEFFSNAYSHSLPETGPGRSRMIAQRQHALKSDLESYVLKMAPSLRQVLRGYSALLDDESVKVFRYEDAIMHKRQLIADICSFFSWTVPDQLVTDILGWADVFPPAERPTEFVRKVLPKDHVEKLSTQTIAQLNRLMGDELSRFGYV